MKKQSPSRSIVPQRITPHDRGSLFDSLKTAIFVFTTTFIIFIAFRNTVTWHLQKFWGTSGDFWQSLWESVHGIFNNDFEMFVFGGVLITTSVFWIANAFFIIIDLVKPVWLQPYRIQSARRISKKRIVKAVLLDLFNQLVLGTFALYLSYKVSIWRGCDMGRTLPTFPEVAMELFVFIWVEEIMFYYSHRLFHHPRIYKYIHKIHHEWTTPIGIVSIYAHPVEHLLANLFPLITGPILCGSHVATSWLWYIMAIINTTNSHSGYHLPFLPSPEAHDFHHYSFTQCYGMLGVLDRLHGTDAIFRKTVAYERHYLSFSLTPMKILHPEKEKCEKL